MGRKPYKPTEESRKKVEQMSAIGIPQEDIARVLGIDKKTLIKYYRDELDNAAVKANTAVGGSLYRKAINGDTSAQIFWMKTRARWSEKSEIEHTIKPPIINDDIK